MDLLEDIRMSLLNVCFVIIYIIPKMLVLPKNHQNFLKDNVFDCLRSITSFYFLKN